MKNLSLAELRKYSSVSFDIDGTVYPIRKVQWRWWRRFFVSPVPALRFYQIKRSWEKRRRGDSSVVVSSEDVRFFEEFLVSLLDPSLVPDELRKIFRELPRVYFLSDHGAAAKLSRLGLSGIAVNCLGETGELKPHLKICDLLRTNYEIDPSTHLHVGDRWTDEEQARMFGSSFRHFQL